MPIEDMNNDNSSPVFETLEDKIKLLLTTIAAEETKLACEIQASIENIQSVSGLTGEQFESNPASTIANLIEQNMSIEQVLKESIKKEMSFQLDLEKLLFATPEQHRNN